MFGAYPFGAPYFGQSPSYSLVLIAATPDYLVLMPADDTTVRIFADDSIVSMPADDSIVRIVSDDCIVQIPPDDTTGVL